MKTLVDLIIDVENIIYMRKAAQNAGESGIQSQYEIDISRPILSEIFGLDEIIIHEITNNEDDSNVPTNYKIDLDKSPNDFLSNKILKKLDELEKRYDY